MPTINEVWEQAQRINANLVIVHNDLVDLNHCCDVSNQRLDDIQRTLNDGFAALATGINVLIQRQDQTNQLLAFQAQQNQTIICALENISRNTCDLVNCCDEQAALQDRIAEDASALRHLTASAHPDAALELQRALEDQARMNECCPPDPRKPPCTYEPCKQPKVPGKPRDDDRQFDGYTKRPVRKLTPSAERASKPSKSKAKSPAKTNSKGR